VYAASSLSPALQQVTTAYDAMVPDVTLTTSTDSSAALETKIEQGAPADAFLSADTVNPEKLVDKGLATGAVVPFAGNRLTIVVPAANPARVKTPADLARPGLKVIAAGDAVPITTYATKLVANLAREPGYPPDFALRYDANIVSKEDNVAAVLSKVALGEGDAGIVYVTDARASRQVTTIAVPADAEVSATYGAVALKASRDVPAAQAFIAWLAGPAGQSVLGAFGFQSPS
jgi:molybdate transport system substrate-binding protein